MEPAWIERVVEAAGVELEAISGRERSPPGRMSFAGRCAKREPAAEILSEAEGP